MAGAEGKEQTRVGVWLAAGNAERLGITSFFPCLRIFAQ